MLRPEIEDYNTGSYEGLLGYAKDLDSYLDYLEICQQNGIHTEIDG